MKEGFTCCCWKGSRSWWSERVSAANARDILDHLRDAAACGHDRRPGLPVSISGPRFCHALQSSIAAHPGRRCFGRQRTMPGHDRPFADIHHPLRLMVRRSAMRRRDDVITCICAAIRRFGAPICPVVAGRSKNKILPLPKVGKRVAVILNSTNSFSREPQGAGFLPSSSGFASREARKIGYGIQTIRDKAPLDWLGITFG